MGSPFGALTVAWVMALLALPPASAQERVALVIGNGKYEHATTLPNPANDARAMADALREIGFDVAEGRDLDRTGMERQLRDFLRKSASARVALLFYAGHGMQVDGRNYLVPVDARLERATDLNFETVELDRILDTLNDAQRASIVILDACRDNPLARSFAARLGATRSGAVSTGLAGYSALGTGTLIAFSTAPGKVALDGAGANSPFTEALAKHLRTPGLEVRQLLTRVRADVAGATRGQQVPWDNSSLLGEVFLSGRPAPPPLVAAPPSADAVLWDAIRDSKVAALFDEFLARHPRSPHAADARRRLEELKPAQVAVVAPPVTPATPTSLQQPAVGVSPAPFGAAPLSPARERGLRPKDTFRECDACPEMVVIPPGEFMLGSPDTEKNREPWEGPQVRMRIGAPLAVGRFEVTLDEYRAFLRESRHDTGAGCVPALDPILGKIDPVAGVTYANPGYAQTGSHPAVCVSWDDAQAYLSWLSNRTGRTYRLLSESEWEYAARAGSSEPYSFGSERNELCRYGNVGDKSFDGSEMLKAIDFAGGHGEIDCSDGHVQAAPVGQFAANAFGLHDMHGNVEEWVQDCTNMLSTGLGYRKEHPQDGAPVALDGCRFRGIRGGSWSSGMDFVRSASRSEMPPAFRMSSIGFRVARPVGQGGPSADDDCYTGVALGRERMIASVLGLAAIPIDQISKSTVEACTRVIAEGRLSGTQLAIAHASLGLARSAGAADFERALEADPDNADALAYRAVHHLGLNDVASAIADLDKAIARAPHAGQLHAWRGIAEMVRALKLGESAKAAAVAVADAHLQRALRIDPSVGEASLARALLLLNQGKSREALDVLEPAIARGYRNAVTLAFRGTAHQDLGQRSFAESDFRAALAADPVPEMKRQLERRLEELAKAR
jgi:formylglycine-generating enzyme required for sulfatase activity/Tfp pilus assembly protein PilF